MNSENSSVEAVDGYAYDFDPAKPLPKWSLKCFVFGHSLGPTETILSAAYVPAEIETPTLIWSGRPDHVEQAVAGEPGWCLARTDVQRCTRCQYKNIELPR